MDRSTKISPSMMCAGLTGTETALREFEKAGIEYLHIDIMDGVFVPNFALGTDYCTQLKKLTYIPLDIHLMVTEPEKKLSWFPIGKNDIVSVHAESTANLSEALMFIRSKGARAFIALNPETPVESIENELPLADGILIMTVHPGFAGQKMVEGSLEKIAGARRFLDENGFCGTDIEVDGNVSFENSVKMKNAGANIFVSGTSGVFNTALGFEQAIKKYREGLELG